MKPRLLLVALGLGAVAYLLTREIIVGLLVAGASLGLLRRPLSGPQADSSTLPSAVPQVERTTGMRVVCKRVTAERQEWVSVRTGRIFEVMTSNGPPGAKPGDPGEVVSSASSYRIVTPDRLDP